MITKQTKSPRAQKAEARDLLRAAARAERQVAVAQAREVEAQGRFEARGGRIAAKRLARARAATREAEDKADRAAIRARGYVKRHGFALEPNGELFPQVKELNPKETPAQDRRRRALYAALVPLLRAVVHLTYGAKVIRDGEMETPRGAVVVINHVCYLDSVMAAVALWPDRLRFLALASNGYGHVWGPIVRALGTIFVGHTLAETREMVARQKEALAAGDDLAVYPEGNLVPYNRRLQPFKRGAFQIAAAHGVPVVPVTLVQVPGVGFLKSLIAKPGFEIHVGDPIYAPAELGTHKAAIYLQRHAYETMAETLGRDPLLGKHFAPIALA